MAHCLMENEIFTAYKDKRVVDPETGVANKVSVPKRIRPWFYTCNDSYFLEIKYGSKSLELAPKKFAITIGEKENLITTINTVIAHQQH